MIIFYFFLNFFFKVQLSSNVYVDLDFTEADDESTTAGDKAHTSVRRKNVDNLTIL